MKCIWCEKDRAKETTNTVYWELPDGSRAIQLKDTPAIACESCGIEYQQDHVVEEIEDQLLIIDTKKLPESASYKELMEQPKLLKRNYFNFSND